MTTVTKPKPKPKLNPKPKSAPRKASSRVPAAPVASVPDDEIDRVGPLRLPYEMMDNLAYAGRARMTGSMAPTAAAVAWFDWALHLAFSPGKQRSLWDQAVHAQQRFANYAVRAAMHPDCPTCVKPLEQDRRFSDPAWQRWPFSVMHQGFLLQQQWWEKASTGVRGASKHHEDMVGFAARQWLDMFSPSNNLWTNPEVLKATVESGGMNLWHGAANFMDDARRQLTGEPPAGTEDFVVGKDVAVTPGKVVFSNHLIELIQYSPTTPKVHAEPVLIVPSWVMKYYILDLSPENSLVRWLVEQGHTVFIISWKNPDAEDRNLGLDDYRELGVMAALDAVTAIAPERKIQAAGYCMGGTLLAIAAAAMARDGDDRLHSLTLLATEVDYRETGEIKVFVDESQLAWLEAGMWRRGYLEGSQMGGSFQMLNSRDLVWSRQVREYLLGERQGLRDLMAWNADTTRMPYRMHSEYLRHLFMNNDLAEGRWLVDGRPVILSDIRVPMFVVGTVRDHVAPWRSVYKVHMLNSGPITFVLTSGGHNAGIVSPPDHPRRTHQIATRKPGSRYVDPDQWQADTPKQQGSWWPAWNDWLAQLASKQVTPPAMGGARKSRRALPDAPGSYIRQR